MTTQTLPPPAAVGAHDTDSADGVVERAAPQPSDAVRCGDEGVLGLPVILNLRPLLGGKTLAEIDPDRRQAFIAANDLYAIEYHETGELVIMPPMMMPGGNLEMILLAAVFNWGQPRGGIVASSATVFRIPGLGGRGPDASWVSPERLAALDAEQYRTGQVCPDFVAEIRSAHDTLAYLQRKMTEYIAAGARLGWLIDPSHRRVIVYRTGREPEILDNPAALYGEDVMPGFEFRVGELIFDAADA